MDLRNPFKTLNKFERILWIISAAVVTLSFLLGNSGNFLTLITSLTGVTALIFVAKGHVFGQILTLCFSLLYSIISYTFHYYGEMITYLGMTAPIAALSIAAWLRHPYQKGKPEVKVAKLSAKQITGMWVLAGLTTLVFYFILKYFNTPNLAPSTLSITTSFLASYLMLFRSPFYALAYASNDMVLIILWILACLSDFSYLPMVICFVMFLINDLYGFYNWRKMMHRQNKVIKGSS